MSPINYFYQNFVKIKQYEGFTRLIPRTLSHSVEEGIKARVKDPLWFLSRQWQLGEFRAINGGKLARTEVTTITKQIDKIQLNKNLEFQDLTDPELPIEPIVEKENIE